jgi:hypothetical protein
MKTIFFKKSIFTIETLGLILLLNLMTISCKKETIIEHETIIYKDSLDKKIILPILDDHYGANSGMDTTLYVSSLINFNKNDYADIDSIFFVVSSFKTISALTGIDVNKALSIELFDLTHNVAILGSSIVTDDINQAELKSSINIINALPTTPINLGIRIINDNTSLYTWELHAASIIMVRK